MRLLLRSLFLFLTLECSKISAIWTAYDMVRPRVGAWNNGSDGITPFIKISPNFSNGPILQDGAAFGFSVTTIGDLDEDGLEEIAVGAIGESVNYDDEVGDRPDAGSIYILFLFENGTVRSSVRISGLENGGPKLFTGDEFGYSIAAMGDLNNDSIPDIAVGAPGVIISSVYLLYLERNGSVGDTVLVRGEFTGAISPNITANSTSPRISGNNSFSPNGPPISFGSRFGTSICSIGDLNNDGFPDMAVSSLASGGGGSIIFIMFMLGNGTMQSFTSIGSNLGGGPDINQAFASFGSALMRMPDMDGDSVDELVVGGKDLNEPGSDNRRSGVVFVLFMNRNGTAKRVTTLSETSIARRLNDYSTDNVVPAQSFDQCGASLAFIGDINRDQVRQQRPNQLSSPPRPSIDDIVTGCPGTLGASLPGRFFFYFLTVDGELNGYTKLPADTDDEINLPIDPFDGFGQSMAAYRDIDKNGMQELIIGAPGDDNGDQRESGAVYIIFLRRRRHHGLRFNFTRFIILVTVLPVVISGVVFGSIALFFWYFRRKPDDVEIIVNKMGYDTQTLGKSKKPKVTKVHIDYYTT